jgi:glucose dehydrogenase
MINDGRWNYDDSNENLLVDLAIRDGQLPALVRFDPQGLTYVLDRRSGKVLGTHIFDPLQRWTDFLSH